MLIGTLLVIVTLAFVVILLAGAYREARKECRSESWNHRGAV